MSDMNLDIIQNKLDALVEKIIQNETSNEDFRITYAQILEKINTKIDVFSGTENLEKLAFISMEIRDAINKRQEVVDSKFSAIKSEFDRVNDILINSFQSKDVVSSYERMEEMIKKQQEENAQKHKEVVDFLESFNALEETNDNLKSNFAIIKEQNTISSENFAKQMELLKNSSAFLEESNSKTMKNFESVLFTLQEFADSLNEDFDGIKDFIGEKTSSAIEKIHETDSFIELLNNNLSTLIQVVGSLFEDEEFVDLQSDVTDILTKISFITESLKKLAEKDDITAVKSQLDKLQQVLLEKFTDNANCLSKATDDIKNEISSTKDEIIKAVDTAQNSVTEEITDAISAESVALSNQMEELGTVVVDNAQSVNNSIGDLSGKLNDLSAIVADKALSLNNSISDLGAELTDVISTESVATSEQIKNVADAVGEFKASLADIKSELSDTILNTHNEQINTALTELKSKFVEQLIQIADNISFDDEIMEISDNIQDCSDELKAQISSDIAGIKQEISLIRDVSGSTDENIINILEKLENALKNDLGSNIKALSNGFKILTSGLGEKDYVYTLPDIESDLSKIRFDLNKIQNSIMQTDAEAVETGADIASKINSIKESLDKLQNDSKEADIADIKALFTSLNEDVSSISKRTNKLILSSDEVSKTLNSNIISFTSVMRAFEKQSREFYNSAMLKDMSQKVNNIAQTGTSISQSNKILNEAFMYLAEWIDSASETFEDITDDITVIKDKMLASSTDEEADKLSRNVKSLTIRVEEQDSKLEELENKIDAVDEKLNKIISAQGDAKETKSLLEYIASQISVANEKIVENEKLALKMASMDKQLKKIEKNIAIITEYIDEEDADDFDEE